MPSYAPISLQHINLVVPNGTLHLAEEFYGQVIGFGTDPVPQLQKDTLRWFRIADGPQQIHVAFERQPNHSGLNPLTSRHPCFACASGAALAELQQRIWEHSKSRSEAAAQECDEPGQVNSGEKGVEYPTRFFCRDYAGNKLEFSAPGTA